MAQIRHFPGSGLRAAGQTASLSIETREPPVASAEKYCVYNQTRQRFIATDVESADASAAKSEARLRDVGQPGANGLWIFPYLGISPSSVSFPVDLVFVNNDCVVVEIVESFPLSNPTPASVRALNLLVLPADTVALGEIRTGDQLIVAAPGEMKWHLQRIKDAKQYEAKPSPSPFHERFARTNAEDPCSAEGEAAVQCVCVAAPPTPNETASSVPEVAPQEPPGQQEPASAPPAETCPWKKRTKPKDWLTRLLRGDEEPEDPRLAVRKSLPGLIAYYFNGGMPTAQEVRDMSPTGLYIVTSERWYPGTVVRLTLTDRHHPSVERSITVNAKAVRWGSDGVGLEFILDEQKKRRERDRQLPEQTNGVDLSQVLEFLRNYKASPTEM